MTDSKGPANAIRELAAARAGEAGQGLVEYALVILLVAMAVIVLMAVFGGTVGNMFSTIVGSF